MKFSLLFSLLFISSVSYAEFNSICDEDVDVEYCDNVGKRAYNNFGPPALRRVYIGPIVGVAWRYKGSIITRMEADTMRFSPREQHYYIVGPGGVANYTFLREAREITAK